MKHIPIMAEQISSDASEMDLVSLMTEAKPSSNKPMAPLTQKEGESKEDFDVRRIREILISFYEIPQERVITPIVSDGCTKPGLSIVFSSDIEILLSMDYPDSLKSMLEATPDSVGCRISLMEIQIDQESTRVMPNPIVELPEIFSCLPTSANYAPWQKSPLSNAGITIYESLIIANQDLNFHFAADALAKVFDWLKESHGF